MIKVEFIGNLMAISGNEGGPHPITLNLRSIIAFSDISYIAANEYYSTERWLLKIYLSNNIRSGNVDCHFETKAEAERVWNGLIERLK